MVSICDLAGSCDACPVQDRITARHIGTRLNACRSKHPVPNMTCNYGRGIIYLTVLIPVSSQHGKVQHSGLEIDRHGLMPYRGSVTIWETKGRQSAKSRPTAPPLHEENII